MTISSRLIAIAAAFALLTGPVLAQSPAPATPTAPAVKATPKAKPQRTAQSLECSKEADAKGLHGKERHKFRSDCKKNATKAN